MTLPERILQIALSHLGERETSQNVGPVVAWAVAPWTRHRPEDPNPGPGWALWCAAFVSTVVLEALQADVQHADDATNAGAQVADVAPACQPAATPAAQDEESQVDIRPTSAVHDQSLLTPEEWRKVASLSVEELHARCVERGWIVEAPERGGLVFFCHLTNGRALRHVGFVDAVDPDGTVHSVEGNATDQVRRRKYGRGDANLHSFARLPGVPI